MYLSDTTVVYQRETVEIATHSILIYNQVLFLCIDIHR